jgi:TonB family protein
MPRASAATNCAATEAPEALATPGPLLQTAGSGARFTVSFIVGTDGRVHSPLILQGSDSDEDRAVLSAVQSWKYRPARCNGVPMEAEGRIEFLSH